jgi:hypothetical protein
MGLARAGDEALLLVPRLSCLLRAEAAGTLTLESLEFDAGIPGKYSVPDDKRWTTKELLDALEKSESKPPIAEPDRAPTADTERLDRLPARCSLIPDWISPRLGRRIPETPV